jgi:hypothetical protein
VVSQPIRSSLEVEKISHPKYKQHQVTLFKQHSHLFNHLIVTDLSLEQMPLKV